FDEDLMEKYLGGEELTVEEIKAAIRKATLAVEFYPVVCGTSFKNKGVQLVLDAVIDYLPAPTDVEAIVGINPETQEEEKRESDDEGQFSALAFIVMYDPFVGMYNIIRVDSV